MQLTNVLSERAVSVKQQRFMGMVYKCKKTGECNGPSVRKAAKSISEKEARKFAKTKHKGLPMKKTNEGTLPSFMDFLFERDVEFEGVDDDMMSMYQELSPKRQAIVRHIMQQMIDSGENGDISGAISDQFDDQEAEDSGDFSFPDDEYGGEGEDMFNEPGEDEYGEPGEDEYGEPGEDDMFGEPGEGEDEYGEPGEEDMFGSSDEELD